ncbi:MAG: hypothetical protein CVT63_04830 [Candidatus Anoxymicrobium japonicum]|uniref:DUF4015 domain-containing protein n=1 Tax=Candidatus Anoxymicrobium japonicum TaxID=2013648 RepID=A0A2N3G5Q1_9ACTN|nr:MAG: hypothetical protein CVT63_04830 [Candidatus Anoxymicrobium japonicum]
MARKRTFSNRRGGHVFGGRKPRLIGDNLDLVRREAQGGQASHSSEDLSRDAKDSERRPVEMPALARSVRVAAPGYRKRKGFTGAQAALGAIFILVAVIVFWFFAFVYPSPIGGLSPANGSYVKTPTVDVKASISRSFKPQDITMKIDGKDVGVNVLPDKKTVSATVPLPDGPHRAMLRLDGHAFMGKRIAQWSFNIDSTPPELSLTKKKITRTKKPGEARIDFKCNVEKGASVTVNDRPIAIDKKGDFSCVTVTNTVHSLKILAKDRAGNEKSDFIITQKAPTAKGIHVSTFIAASDTDFDRVIALVDRTELNALQIDLKDEAGQIGFNINNTLAQQAKAASNYIKLDECVDRMRFKNIYSIARIVCFKDPKVGRARPDLAVQGKAGGPWGKGDWLDPYSKEVWDYDLAVAEAAARAGFNEIQFDYVRFPSDGNTSACAYPRQDARKPSEVINDFLTYAREKLAPFNVFISTDLFGLTASKQGDMNIGQNIVDIAKRVDFISPMVYPSHYNPGEYGIKTPEANPGDTVTKSIEEFKKKMAGTQSRLRPWLQDFSLKIPYTPDMVRRQIDACEKLGMREWLLWDPNCTYSESALKK